MCDCVWTDLEGDDQDEAEEKQDLQLLLIHVHQALKHPLIRLQTVSHKDIIQVIQQPPSSNTAFLMKGCSRSGKIITETVTHSSVKIFIY